MRRDHAKYLTLIDSIAFLHQHQRPVQTTAVAGEAVEYVEVTLEDIALANRLAHDVLGRSLDELPPQTRRVLGLIVEHIAAQAQQQALDPALIRFTRRELRETTGLGDTQLKLHLARLEDHEYLLVHRHGQRHGYELLFDGHSEDARRQMIGLLDVEALRERGGNNAAASATTVNRSGQIGERSGSGRAVVGGRSGTGRSEETPRNASADAAISSLVAAVEETPLLRNARRPVRRTGNGAAVATG